MQESTKITSPITTPKFVAMSWLHKINYPNLKHSTQDSLEQAIGWSHEEGSSLIFMLDDM